MTFVLWPPLLPTFALALRCGCRAFHMQSEVSFNNCTVTCCGWADACGGFTNYLFFIVFFLFSFFFLEGYTCKRQRNRSEERKRETENNRKKTKTNTKKWEAKARQLTNNKDEELRNCTREKRRILRTISFVLEDLRKPTV